MRARLAEVSRGEYEVLETIGVGGMGWVFLARDIRLGRRVALKMLPLLDALRPAALERFQQEAETAARLTHPHIVPIYGAGGDAATPYFAMAYIEGETLAGRLEREPQRRLPPDDVLRLTREVGSALAYAHRQGVIHRDIKPANVLLERDSGRALVTDFGIARLTAGAGLTQSGFAVGTPGYMAPEQAGALSDLDARVDVYALGVLMFEMTTGRAFEQVDNGEFPVTSGAVQRAVAGSRPDLPPQLPHVIVRATAPRREDRYGSVDELLADLDAHSRAPHTAHRAPALLGIVILVLGLLGLGRIAWFLLAPPPEPAAGPAGGASIALLPFGGDVAAADTLLPMLRYQLGGFAVRVADPRVFNAQPADDPAAPAVRARAARAGAAWILHGFIGTAGEGREILVRAVDVASGRILDLGRDTVHGMSVAAADAVVLRLAGSDAGRALGLTTTRAVPVSLEAVRAFNSAEEAFRRADYAKAVRDYDRVIRLDTAFGLARYKRFLAALQEEPSEPALRAAVAEMRRAAPRVGSLERRLLSAYLVLFDSGNVAAAEQRLTALITEDSTFLDGWFALGEVRYHFGALAGIPPEAAEAAFARAAALWDQAAPAVMHLIALHLFQGREADARADIDRYLAFDSTSAVGRTVALGRRVMFGSLAERRRVLDALPGLDDRVLEFGAINGATVARDRSDLTATRLALREMTRAGRAPAIRSEGARFLVLSYATEGRWREADSVLREQRAALPGDRELALAPALLAALRTTPPVRDTATEIARLTRRLVRLDDAAHAPFGIAASAWPDRWQLARLSLARGDTAAAVGLLEAQEFLAAFADQTVRGPAWLLRGRIHAARGDRDAAIRYLRRSASLLRYAEPPWDAVRDSARAKLLELGVQP